MLKSEKPLKPKIILNVTAGHTCSVELGGFFSLALVPTLCLYPVPSA